jgi:hypothetical protein
MPNLLLRVFAAASLRAQNPWASSAGPLRRKLHQPVASPRTLPRRQRLHRLSPTARLDPPRPGLPAQRSGTRLTRGTDGVTHPLAIAETSSSLVGEWQYPRGPVRINANRTAAIGDKAHRWNCEAGRITFSGTGDPLRVAYGLAGDL